MSIKRDPSKLLQFGFVGLLIISLAQVGYWIFDGVTHTRAVEVSIRALYDADAEILTAAFAGADRQQLAGLAPHVAVDAAAGSAVVRDTALAALAREANVRVNRFLWEGGFFLVVLLGGLAVLTRAIRHDAELRLRQQNFLAAVSHEFKSPLASIRLSAETLILRSRESESQRLGQRILEDDDRLLRMIENLLDTTRLEEGRQPLSPEQLMLRDAASACVEAVAARAKLNDIEITLDIDPELKISADQGAFETILRNLLDNSINACVAGRGRRIELTARRSGDDVEIRIGDDGAGFPPNEAEMIFEKFYRAGDELRRATPGSGLGLYIVRRLAQGSGARIVARSDGPGKGAEFTLTWPRHGTA